MARTNGSQDMTRLVVMVDFTIPEGQLSAFIPLMLTNAHASLALESGCECFDVLRPEGSNDRVLLYEIYRDQAAFDEHCHSPHYLEFAHATQAMVQSKSVMMCAFAQTDSMARPA